MNVVPYDFVFSPKAALDRQAPGPRSITSAVDSPPPTTESPSPLANTEPIERTTPAENAAPIVTTSAQSPEIATAFDGLHYGTNAGFSNPWVPPDVQVAVGPNHIVEMVNTLIAVYTKQGTPLSTDELFTFFGVPSGDFISDPKIQYDAASGRWFASITDITSSSVRLAVSSTSDPTDPWHTSSVGGTGCLDQPILGAGTASVIVSVNVFSSCTSRNYVYLGAQYWVLNKSDLVAGRAAASASFGPFSTQGSVHPVQVLGTSSSHFLVTVDWPSGSSANAIILYNVTGAPPSTVTVIPTRISIRTVSVPPAADQSGSRHSLDTSDIRVSDAAWSDGKIWFGLDTGCTPSGDSQVRACVRLVEVDTASSKVLQDFDVAVAGKHLFYPALRTDGAGNLVAAFGFSSANDFPGVMVTGRLFGDTPNTVQPPVLVKAGSGPEDPSSCSSTCRYGDYFGSALDPADPTLVWSAIQFGTSSGWGTHIFGARVKALLTLSYSINGGGSGYSLPTLTYVQGGQSYTVALETTPAMYAADPDSAWSVTATLTAPGRSEERWRAAEIPGDVLSGVANTSMDRSLSFYYQYRVTFGYAVVLGTPSGLTPPRVSADQFGTPSSVALGAPVWVDAGGAYSLEPLLRESTSSERWMNNNPSSGTITAPGAFGLAYYHQYEVTFAFSVVGGGSGYSAPSVACTAFGVQTSVQAIGTVWVDALTNFTYPSVLAGSTSTERWFAASGLEGALETLSRVEVVYHHQYFLSVTTDPAEVGSVGEQSGWYDADSSAVISAAAPAGWQFQGWSGTGAGSYSGANASASVTLGGPITQTASFFPGLTIKASGGGSVTYTFGTTTDTVPTGSSVTIYVPPGSVVSLVATPNSQYDAFDGWSGGVSNSPNGASVRVEAPTSVTANFGPSAAYVIVPTAIILAIVGLVAFVAWRRYRKRRP